MGGNLTKYSYSVLSLVLTFSEEYEIPYVELLEKSVSIMLFIVHVKWYGAKMAAEADSC